MPSCGALSLTGSQYIPTLFEMGTVRGFRVERITCDEEERLREGFEIETRYRFAPAPDGRALQQQATVRDQEGRDLLQLTFAPQAELWRVNQRWRRSDRPGFTLDTKSGYWARRPDDDDKAPDAAGKELRTGIRPFVRDTRNILLDSHDCGWSQAHRSVSCESWLCAPARYATAVSGGAARNRSRTDR